MKTLPKPLRTLFALALALGLCQGVATAQPSVELRSAGALEFGPGGVLFVGDSYGSQVVAIETNDTRAPADPAAPVYVESLDVELAALLGTAPEEIYINDMAVNPASQNVYLSVHVGRSVDPGVAIVRYNKDGGELEPLELETFTTSKVDIPDAPAFEDELQYGQSQRILAITDLTYYEGELFIAGVSNQEFASTLRRAAYPFTGEVKVSSVEIYHAGHNRQETRAPIVTSLVHEIEGEPHLVAAYTCTPLVTIPLDDLRDGAHVIGTTVAELGFGNAPVDMFVYQNPEMMGGGERLLVTNDQRSAVSVSTSSLAGAEPLTEQAMGQVGLDQMNLPLTGALHTAPLNDALTVTLRYNVRTRDLSLMSVVTGAFFEVSESIVEYNWPGVEPSDFPSINPIDYSLTGQ